MNSNDPKYRALTDALHVGNDDSFIQALSGLGKEFDPNMVPYRSAGDSLLHIIARLGRTSLLKFLIAEFGNVDQKKHNLNLELTNTEGKTALHEAAQFGRYDIVEILLKEGVYVNPLKRADWTPLMMAVTKVGLDAQKVVSILLNQGHADPNLRNKDGWNAFHLAAREGDMNILRCIYSFSPQSCQTVSNNNRTPAHTAALHGKLDVLEFLLENCGGACFAAVDSCGATPLLDAARAGNLAAISYLIPLSDPAAVDKMGRNSLGVAAHSGKTDIVRYLVQNVQMNPNEQSKDFLKMAPIHWAAKEGHVGTIRCLVQDLNAQANLRDEQGRTALAIAIAGNRLETTKYLLASVDFFDMKLLTPTSLSEEMRLLLQSTFAEWNMKLYIPSTSNGGT